MSEEMNLYKRCKNIFKAHGVDMGGGGSGGGELDIIIDLGDFDSSPVLIKGNYEEIAAKIGHDAIAGLVKYTVEYEGEITRGAGSILCAAHVKSSTEDVIEFVFRAFSGMIGLKFYPDGTIEIAM